MSLDSTHTKCFLAGVAAASASFYILSRTKISSERSQSKLSSSPPNSKSVQPIKKNNDDNSNATDNVKDSPDLQLRLIRKAETAIMKRTSRITVVIERCTNDFNYSAILRTVEALGIQHVWLIAPPPKPTDREQPEAIPDISGVQEGDVLKAKFVTNMGKTVTLASKSEIESRCGHHLFAQKAAEWLTIREFQTTADCLAALEEDGRTIWATDLGQEADCLTKEGLSTLSGNDSPEKLIPKRLAIVFGTESVGCSMEMLNASHRRVYLPLSGFADSLNLSVATALCLLQLFHLCPDVVGDMSETERHDLRQVWYTKLASQRIPTTLQKKTRTKLLAKIKSAEEVQRKQQSGGYLTVEQVQKLNTLTGLRSQLEQSDQELMAKAKKSVKGLIDNPPAPLLDMRRADEHRICYVGKNTKQRNQENWKDMPATTNTGMGGKVTTAAYFREMVKSS